MEQNYELEKQKRKEEIRQIEGTFYKDLITDKKFLISEGPLIIFVNYLKQGKGKTRRCLKDLNKNAERKRKKD